MDDDDLKGLTTAEINERLGYAADAGIVPQPVSEPQPAPALDLTEGDD